MILDKLILQKEEKVPNYGLVSYETFNETKDFTPIPDGFSESRRYFLYLKLGTRFVANEAELPLAKERVEKQIRYELYKDVVSSLYEILNVADNKDTIRITSKLLKELTGR